MFPGCTLVDLRVRHQELVREAERSRVGRDDMIVWLGGRQLAAVAQLGRVVRQVAVLATSLVRAI